MHTSHQQGGGPSENPQSQLCTFAHKFLEAQGEWPDFSSVRVRFEDGDVHVSGVRRSSYTYRDLIRGSIASFEACASLSDSVAMQWSEESVQREVFELDRLARELARVPEGKLLSLIILLKMENLAEIRELVEEYNAEIEGVPGLEPLPVEIADGEPDVLKQLVADASMVDQFEQFSSELEEIEFRLQENIDYTVFSSQLGVLSERLVQLESGVVLGSDYRRELSDAIVGLKRFAERLRDTLRYELCENMAPGTSSSDQYDLRACYMRPDEKLFDGEVELDGDGRLDVTFSELFRGQYSVLEATLAELTNSLEILERLLG